MSSDVRVGVNKGYPPFASFAVDADYAKHLYENIAKQEYRQPTNHFVSIGKKPDQGLDLEANRFFSMASTIDLYFKTFIQASAVALVYYPASAVCQKFNDWSMHGRSLTAPLYFFKTVSDLCRSRGQDAEKIVKAFFDVVVATSLNWKIWEEFFFDSKNQFMGRVLTVATCASDICEVKEQVGNFHKYHALMNKAKTEEREEGEIKAYNEARNIAAAKGLAYATAVLVGVVAITTFASSRFSGQNAILSSDTLKIWDLSGTLIKGAACFYESSRTGWAHKNPFPTVEVKEKE